jgi:tetratricopeptide (TPR) repeat protein
MDDIIKPKKVLPRPAVMAPTRRRKFRPRPIIILLSITLLGVLIWLASNFWSNFLLQRGQRALDQNNFVLAEADWQWAKYFGHADIFDRAIADLKIRAIRQLLTATNQSDPKNLSVKFSELYGQAIDSAKAATDWNAHNYLNWFSLGQVYEVGISLKINGSVEQARAAYQKAATLNSTWSDVWLALARVELAAGQTVNSRADLLKALAQKPADPDILLNLAQLDYNRGQLGLALSEAGSAVKAAPTQTGAWFASGFLNYQAGNYESAVSNFKQVLSLTPNSADTEYFLGLALAKLGRTTEAINLFETLVQANPTNSELKNILANLKAGRPALSSALKSASSLNLKTKK